MIFSEIDYILRETGKITVYIDNYPLTLDMRNLHERRYASCFVAHIKYPSLDIDRFLIELFVKDKDVVLDAGANIGLTALLFVQAGADQVVALEPVPILADRIRSIPCPLIQCQPHALSAKESVTTLYLSVLHNQGSTYDRETIALFPQVFGHDLKTITVQTTTIDMLKSQFDVWKLDIEGAEIDALDGAVNHLNECPPRVIIAELYANKYAIFADKIKGTHKYSYRACIRKDNYSLSLIDPPEYESRAQDFHPLAPTFVFLQSPL